MVTLDESLKKTLKDGNWREAPLSPRERAMLEYVEKLTLHAYKATRDDLAVLKEHGFDDRAILQINLIASFFNYINRVADGLGVGRE
jgi:uncharacterized peroxidase-related enzyme